MSTLSTYPEAVTRLQSSCESYRALSLPKPTYRQFLAESSLSAAQRDGSGIGEEDWWLNRLRFLDLLASTAGARTQAGTTGTPYEVEEIIKKLKPYSNVLVAEMVLLYTMEGRHEDAFKLLVHDLRDFDGCVDHCLFGGGKIAGSPAMDRADQERFFGMFLIEALKLEHWAVRLEWVESILDRWGGWLDVVQVRRYQ